MDYCGFSIVEQLLLQYSCNSLQSRRMQSPTLWIVACQLLHHLRKQPVRNAVGCFRRPFSR